MLFREYLVHKLVNKVVMLESNLFVTELNVEHTWVCHIYCGMDDGWTYCTWRVLASQSSVVDKKADRIHVHTLP